MKKGWRAFTLPELLVVVAIIALLSAVLFPVLVSAREAARTAVCVNNFRQASHATGLYLQDYDDLYMPINHTPADANSSNDRTWVQMIMPYLGTYSIFRCPADYSDRPRREATFDEDLVPGDTFSQYYTASIRTNLGYNFIHFAPVYIYEDDLWRSQPRTSLEIAEPSATFLFIDSVYSKKTNGTPDGGGSWLVVPPCRYDEEGGEDTFMKAAGAGAQQVYTDGADGWEVGIPSSRFEFGGTYPWHRGRYMTAVRADGSAKALTPLQLQSGCDTQPNWTGFIKDRSVYQWDFN